jgi:hypothetical protein
MGQWMYWSTCSWPRHGLEVSGQLDAPTVSSTGRESDEPKSQCVDNIELWKFLIFPGLKVRPLGRSAGSTPEVVWSILICCIWVNESETQLHHVSQSGSSYKSVPEISKELMKKSGSRCELFHDSYCAVIRSASNFQQKIGIVVQMKRLEQHNMLLEIMCTRLQ